MKELVKEGKRLMFTARDWNFMKGEEKVLHSKGGRTPFILIQMIRITGQRMYSCAARPKLLGKEHKDRKRRVRVLYRRAKEGIKIKTSLT